jgi:hypothetical protein
MGIGVSPYFLRALALEIDDRSDPAGRDMLLRAVGQQMARMMALPPVNSLEALEMEINSALERISWGTARLAVNEAERCVLITHTALPRVGSAGEPAGFWLGAALEGLYEGWMAQQPGGDASLCARRNAVSATDQLLIRYERA